MGVRKHLEITEDCIYSIESVDYVLTSHTDFQTGFMLDFSFILHDFKAVDISDQRMEGLQIIGQSFECTID